MVYRSADWARFGASWFVDRLVVAAEEVVAKVGRLAIATHELIGDNDVGHVVHETYARGHALVQFLFTTAKRAHRRGRHP